MNKSIREYCEQQHFADTTGLPGSDDFHRGRRAAFREVVRQIDGEQVETTEKAKNEAQSIPFD